VIAARFGERTVRAGIKGQCDLYGYIRGGLTVEIEIKSHNGRMSPEQMAWQTWCLEWRIPHVVLRAKKEETEEETVERWCLELEELLRSI
jgi:hypothetical protein